MQWAPEIGPTFLWEGLMKFLDVTWLHFGVLEVLLELLNFQCRVVRVLLGCVSEKKMSMSLM